MGLLDDLLGGMAGQGPGGRAQAQPRRTGDGPDMSRVLIALAPIVLNMLANRGRRGGSPIPENRTPGGGGIGDLLGQVLGGSGGAGGGLGGLLEQLQRTGFREQADSWVGRGANAPISPDSMSEIFGKDGLEVISRHAGISPDEASQGLSALLPEVVDRMTPDGRFPHPARWPTASTTSRDASAWRNQPDDVSRASAAGRFTLA